MAIEISNTLKLRLLGIEEFFTSERLKEYPNDRQKLSELMNIKKKQLSLQELVKEEDEGDGGNGGGGRGTIKGLRAKDDPNIRSPLSRRMTRK